MNSETQNPLAANSINLFEFLAAIEPHQTPDGPEANQTSLNIINMPVETPTFAPLPVIAKFPKYYAPLELNYDIGADLIHREEKIFSRTSYYRLNNKDYFAIGSDFVSYDSLIQVADDIESNYEAANDRIALYEKNIELTTDKIDGLYRALKIMKKINTTENDADDSDDDEDAAFDRPYRVETGGACDKIKHQINKAKEHIEQTRMQQNDISKHIKTEVLEGFRRTIDMLKRIGDKTLKISELTYKEKRCINDTMVELNSKKYSVYTIFYYYAREFMEEIKKADEYFEAERQDPDSDVIYYNKDQAGPVEVFRSNMSELSSMMITRIEKLSRYSDAVVRVAFENQVVDLMDSICPYFLRVLGGVYIQDSDDFFEEIEYREYGSVDTIVYKNELAPDARNDRVGVCCLCMEEKTLICRPACRCEPNKETGQLPDHVFICEECTTSQNEYNQAHGKAASCHMCKHEY